MNPQSMDDAKTLTLCSEYPIDAFRRNRIAEMSVEGLFYAVTLAQMMSEAVEAERELKGVSTLSLHVTDFHSSAMPYAFDIIIGKITEDLKSGPGCSCIKF